MDKEEYKVRIGKDKQLVYHPDPYRGADAEFIRRFQEAGASHPATLQDFFVRLAEIQRQPVHQNIPAMQIELRNIKVAEHMSEETTAFTANLYVDNQRIAFVKNEGRGGSTNYQPFKQEDVPNIRKAEEYCNNLPPAVYPETVIDGKPLAVPMNLENYIDDLLDKHLSQKEREKFNKRIEKHQEDSILYGIPDKQYYRVKLIKPIAEILKSLKGMEALKHNIHEKIIPRLKEGESILNTNLPAELMRLERKRPTKQSSRIDDSPDKQQVRKI